jgi:hypothetical protein
LKKEAKLLLIGARGAAALTCYSQKFFGSFFQKRTAFFPALPRPVGFTQNGASSWSPRHLRSDRLRAVSGAPKVAVYGTGRPSIVLR